jgi:hypothetical protein
MALASRRPLTTLAAAGKFEKLETLKKEVRNGKEVK